MEAQVDESASWGDSAGGFIDRNGSYWQIQQICDCCRRQWSSRECPQGLPEAGLVEEDVVFAQPPHFVFKQCAA